MTLPPRTELSPGCVTGVGSLPFLDADEAVEFVAEHCPEFPFWPQLPRRSAGEGVIGQGMGRLIEYLEPSHWPYCWAVRRGAETAFAAALDEYDAGLIPETAEGFFALERAFRSGRFCSARAVKAQLQGPATLAHCLFLQGQPMSRNSIWLERLSRFLERQAAWQVARLSALGLPVVLVLDEPAMALAGRLGPEASAIISALRWVIEAARRERAAVGIHCCAPLPSGLLAGLELDLLSFDANLPAMGHRFFGLARGILRRGGHLAFGLAPTGPSSATPESMESRWLAVASSIGDPTAVAERTLITATCGLGLSSPIETLDSFTLARQLGGQINAFAATPMASGLA